MRSLLRIGALALVLIGSGALGGCAQLSALQSGLDITTKTVTNPVTNEDLYKFEVAFNGAVELLNTYRDACEAGNADLHCKENIRAIQVYTRQIPPYLTQLRGFVRNNNQIGAGTIYNQLVLLYGNAKATASSFGVSIGGV